MAKTASRLLCSQLLLMFLVRPVKMRFVTVEIFSGGVIVLGVTRWKVTVVTMSIWWRTRHWRLRS